MIELKSPSEIERMRRPARIVAEILAALVERVAQELPGGIGRLSRSSVHIPERGDRSRDPVGRS